MPRDMLHDQRESLLSDGVPEPIAVRLKTKEWERESARASRSAGSFETSCRAPPSPTLCANRQEGHRACCTLLLVLTPTSR